MYESLIRWYMKLYEVKPDKNDFSNWEVFKTKEFLNGIGQYATSGLKLDYK